VKRVQNKKTDVILILSGILLLLILSVMIITSANPIGLSKNAMSRFVKPKIVLELPGQMSSAGNGYLFHLDKQALRKIDLEGNTLWERKVGSSQVVWMGPGAFITLDANGMTFWDDNGQQVFSKQGTLKDIRILDVSDDFILVSGKSEQKEHVALMNNKGVVLWIIPAGGTVISGSVNPSGLFAAINLVDSKVCGHIQYIDSQGQKVWEKSYEDLILALELAEDQICAVTEEQVFMLDRDGHEIWKYGFEGELSSVCISRAGNTALSMKVQKGSLSHQEQPKLLMISSEGELLWSYALKNAPEDIYIGQNTVFIADENEITAFSQDGLLMSSFNLSGKKQLQILNSSQIILNQGQKASVLQF